MSPGGGEGDRVERFLDEAIDHYHLLLEKRQASGDSSNAAMLQQMVDAGVTYGGRAICPFLRPNFITRSQFDFVDRVCRGFRGAVMKARDALFADKTLLAQLAMTEGELRLAAIDPGFRSVGVTTRLDTFLVGHDIKFIELNADSPAGVHYGDTMARVFSDAPVMKDFTQRYPIAFKPAADLLLTSILETWREWGGTGTPHVAVVDWTEVATRSEFDLVCAHLRANGVPARFVDPRELEFKGGKLTAQGEPVDLVYRRLLVSELLPREDECKALIDAVSARAVCMLNSFRAKMLTKKLIFAILQDPKVTASYTAEEAEVVRTCIPWTRRVVEGRTIGPDGTEVDLERFLRSHREQLVLKPNDEYGGRGVVIGRNVERAVWEGALQIALSDPSIVQELVRMPARPFPTLEGNSLRFADRYMDLDPYLFRGMLGGVMTRLSSSSLCNVTAGGGSVPTFILEGA